MVIYVFEQFWNVDSNCYKPKFQWKFLDLWESQMITI